jgi:hypothetical protein
MSESLKEIQSIVGTVADGVYGPNTAKAIIKYLKVKNSASRLEYLTRNIQKHVGVWVDGDFGPKTTAAVLAAVKGQVPAINTNPVVSHYPEEYKETPNKSVRKIKPLGVVLHHSDGSFEGSVDWCTRSESKVSYHVVIDTDGRRVRLADDDRRCWHAGVSKFKGKRGCNDFLLGVAFSGNTNHRELTDDEVNSAVEYIAPRLLKYGWPVDLSTITTHREISPGRKNDVDVRAEQRVLAALRKALTTTPYPVN